MIGIYCRISKRKEEGRDVSIAVQKDAGIKFATKQNIPHKLFIDEGISGAKGEIADRPMFAELFKAIEEKKISMVYCYDQSRIERNSNIWSLFVGVMLKNDCKYYPEGKFFDLDDPTNRFFSGILSLSNELYSSLTSKKVKAAIYKNVMEGKAHGLTAYGYQKNEKGYFEANTDEAQIVRKIYNLSIKGIGVYSIAKILNKENIPTKFNRFDGKIKRKDAYTKEVYEYEKKKVRWRGNVIHDMITNTIYKGIRKWKENQIIIPKIVSDETWENANRNLKHNKKKAGKKVHYHYLLNGLLECGNCGSVVRGKRRLKGHDNAYKCVNKTSYVSSKCKDSRGLSIPRLEAVIIRLLFLNEGFRETLLKVPKNTISESEHIKKTIAKGEAELIKCQSRIKRLQNAIEFQELETDEVLLARLVKAKKERDSLVDNISSANLKLSELNSTTNKKIIHNASIEVLKDGNFEAIRSIIHSIIEKVIINHTKKNKGGRFVISIKFKRTDAVTHLTTDWQAKKWSYGFFMGDFGVKQNKFDQGRVLLIDEDDFIDFD